jgi:hypothetical protein
MEFRLEECQTFSVPCSDVVDLIISIKRYLYTRKSLLVSAQSKDSFSNITHENLSYERCIRGYCYSTNTYLDSKILRKNPQPFLFI